MNLKHIRLIAATVATAVAIPFAASAAGLTVNQGDSQTISTNATYDAVVVNGNLTVAPNVTLNCTSLLVANDISGTATLTVGDGATVSVSGGSATKIGVGKGRAEVYLGTGASLRAENGYLNFCYGYDSAPSSSATMTEALLVAGPDSTIYSAADFCFGHASNQHNFIPNESLRTHAEVKAVVRLDEGATLSATRIYSRSAVSCTILFNGGSVRERTGYSNAFILMDWQAQYTTINLEGTNGCPIVLNLPDRGSLIALTQFGSGSCKCNLRGDGGLIKTGAAVFPLVNMGGSWDGSDPNLKFLFTGDLVIREGGFSVATTANGGIFRATSDNMSRPVDLVVKNGASFDLAGCDIGLNSITAAGTGIVTNSAAGTATATIGARNDGRGSTLSRVFPGIAFVKQGNASLTLCGSAIDSLDIQGGTLVVKDRATMGYPLYRFKFDEYGFGAGNGKEFMYLKDIAFLTEGADVTRDYSKLYHDASGTSAGNVSDPTNLVDGNPNTEYGDYRMSRSQDETRDKVQISLEYSECKVIDSYKWAPRYSPSVGYKQNPTAWRVFGGFSPNGGDLLDQVTGYSVVEVDGWTSTNFVLSCPVSPALHVGTLSLANGSKVEATGAQVSCDTFSGSATGLSLDLSSGASLPLTASQSISEISVDLTKDLATVDVLNPAASGKLYVTGDSTLLRGDLLNVGSHVNGSNLRTWSVYLNGTDMHRTLCVEDGALRLTPLATMIYMR